MRREDIKKVSTLKRHVLSELFDGKSVGTVVGWRRGTAGACAEAVRVERIAQPTLSRQSHDGCLPTSKIKLTISIE